MEDEILQTDATQNGNEQGITPGVGIDINQQISADIGGIKEAIKKIEKEFQETVKSYDEKIKTAISDYEKKLDKMDSKNSQIVVGVLVASALVILGAMLGVYVQIQTTSKRDTDFYSKIEAGRYQDMLYLQKLDQKVDYYAKVKK
jgi:hypothetical protein